MADLKGQAKALERLRTKARAALVSKPTIDAELPPLKEDGTSWWHRGQQKIWDARTRIVAAIAGVQSGKTVIGPKWLLREIQRTASPIRTHTDQPNSYLVAGPTLSLLKRQAIPYFRKLFEDELGLGKYDQANNIFEFSPEGSRKLLGYETKITVFFGYANKPESLVSFTIKAAWLDEAGQDDFRKGSYYVIEDRFATTAGRILFTTTPYELTWLYEEIYKPGLLGSDEITVVNYRTVDNPGENEEAGRIIRERVEKARKRLSGAKFRRDYEGLFEKSAGAIYDNFEGDHQEEKRHTVQRFKKGVPNSWKRYWGIDFGPVHTCVVMFAEHPRTKLLYLYGCYLPAETGHGRRTYEKHVEKMTALTKRYQEDRRPDDKPVMPRQIHGGCQAEKKYLLEYAVHGLRIMPTMFFEPENQIECVYGALAELEFVVFNDLKGVIDEFQSYSYKLDDDQEPDETKIKDASKYHRLDAVRYIISVIRPGIHESLTKTVSRFQDNRKKKFSIFAGRNEDRVQEGI